MKRFLQNLALLMLIAGLPLQNLHAAAMPLCGHSGKTTSAQHQSEQDAELVEHDRDESHKHSSTDPDAACDACGMCHACSAPAIASVVIQLRSDAVDTHPVVLTTHTSLFDPDQPKRPPRQS